MNNLENNAENNIDSKAEIIQYKTSGTCCGLMQVVIMDEVIQDVEFLGGCPGNLEAIKQLLKGMQIDEVIAKFSGIKCGDKSTSCADQLALCLEQYKSQKMSKLK